MIGRIVMVLAAGVLACLSAACSSEREPFRGIEALEEPPPTSAVTIPAPDEEPTGTEQTCEEQELAVASFRPGAGDGSTPSIDDIVARGRILIGVDEATLGFAARDPDTNEIEGFEVDLAHEIAHRILVDAYTPEMVQLVPLATDEKTPFAREGKVDMTISAVTMSCDRWEDVAFSAEYYTAHQEFLVRKDSDLTSAEQLDDLTVCVTAGSSSAGIMGRLRPAAELLEVDTRIECLVALQQGQADAYFGHDSFLYGMLVQDPTLEVRSGIFGREETVSHYGIAIAPERIDLVRAVNAALEAIVADGTWAELHGDLSRAIGLPPARPPEPAYRD